MILLMLFFMYTILDGGAQASAGIEESDGPAQGNQ